MSHELSDYVKIPSGIHPSEVQQALTSGHDYQWILLSERTIPISYGSTRRPDMPELRMVGRWIILNKHDHRFSELIERILRALSTRMGGTERG